ncbi:hypothetical protein J2X46_002961 [Nocardioides sp. BE266]|uniref:hypothetical protein n=1 Tax=Nocardioides sp. BE266 TaxID=2817725 RepID=UPI00286467F8|nr:hypothetical protein [Nocardioides sp. BE266]MDR7253971.1 hypothetical protein [Nocardioides sp. BE266]
MDYAISPAPKTDTVLMTLREMISRRVPATTMIDVPTVREFVTAVNLDSPNHPVSALLVGAHANSEGKWFIPLFAGQTDNAKKLTNRTDFENLQQTLEPGALTKQIRVDASTVGFTAPPPTAVFQIKGCNLGKSKPFLVKLKEALGGRMLVSAPKHFQGAYGSPVPGNLGSFEFMSYEFQVQTPARKNGSKFTGFTSRADLIAAFVAADHQYLSGRVPDADWEALVPKKNFNQTQTFAYRASLGGTFAGQTDLVMSPNPKTGLGGGRQFRYYLATTTWPMPMPAGNQAAKEATLKSKIATDDPRFASTHAWPFYERIGFGSLDEYMAGHHWTFEKKAAIGRRVEYTVVIPVTDTSGATPTLFFNFFPAPGAAQALVTKLPPGDPRFYEVV